MKMKDFFRYLLGRLGLLTIARSIIYWLTQFDKNTTHPKRVMFYFYSQFIKKGDLCFDIGANIGNRAEIFLELGAKIVCVEPQKSCCDILRKLFGKNKKVVILWKGIADREGVSELYRCNENNAASTMSKEFIERTICAKEFGYTWTTIGKVHITTLDALILQYGLPKFCKIDVEGFEESVLIGLSKQIPLISFEFHTDFFDGIQKCMIRLSEIGNYKFNFGIGEPTDGKGLLLPEWVDKGELYAELQKFKKTNNSLILGDIYAMLM